MIRHFQFRPFNHCIPALMAIFGLIDGGQIFAGPDEALPLRVASVTPAFAQPAQTDAAVIFYDDFSRQPDGRKRYFEYVEDHGSFTWKPDGGLVGGAMQCQFEKGQVDAGRLHVLFGKHPFGGSGRGIRDGEIFREIYWRVYVKHEAGWEGNPAKLARTTCMAGRDYSQGFIAHVWGGKGDVLCIDPATGIRDNRKVSVRYNDFEHLKWLGLRNGQTPIFSPAESGRWVCVECHVKLNTPGKSDGMFELWIDGKPEASRTDLDWQGTWSEYAINAVFLENYWNSGSTKRQARWFDNFVISTRPIGPAVAAMPPVVTRTEPALVSSWEAEVATGADGKDVVWKSKVADAKALSLAVDGAHGGFTGSRTGKSSLSENTEHWIRVRWTGEGGWSPWHSPFMTGANAGS